MNKQKNLIIVLIIIIFVSLIGGYFLGKSNIFNNNESVNNNIESNSNNNESNKTYLNSFIPYYDIFEFEKLYDIYALSSNEGSYIIIGYKNKMYLVDSYEMSDAFSCADRFVSKEVNGKVTDGIYECEGLGDEGDGYGSVKEINIKAENISKVVLTNYPFSSDAQFSVFFINLNGNVDYYHYGEGGELRLNVLKDYSVKDLKYTCLKSGEIGCDKPQLNLSLLDGKTTNIDNFNWD